MQSDPGPPGLEDFDGVGAGAKRRGGWSRAASWVRASAGSESSSGSIPRRCAAGSCRPRSTRASAGVSTTDAERIAALQRTTANCSGPTGSSRARRPSWRRSSTARSAGRRLHRRPEGRVRGRADLRGSAGRPEHSLRAPVAAAFGPFAQRHTDARGDRGGARGQIRVYAARKVHAELNRLSHPVARCTVERLMKTQRLRGITRATGPRSTGSARTIAPDLVGREFTAHAPHELWVADIADIRTLAGWVYAAFVIDVFSRRVVGWQCSTSLRTEMALDALEVGIWSRERTGADLTDLVHHRVRLTTNRRIAQLSPQLDRGGRGAVVGGGEVGATVAAISKSPGGNCCFMPGRAPARGSGAEGQADARCITPALIRARTCHRFGTSRVARSHLVKAPCGLDRRSEPHDINRSPHSDGVHSPENRKVDGSTPSLATHQGHNLLARQVGCRLTTARVHCRLTR